MYLQGYSHVNPNARKTYNIKILYEASNYLKKLEIN